ncbi:ribosome small subunit-dependent GTPase A [Bacteroidales bacterium OttesenSCG-928-E04]|nr:ribosome small subunit-dependent GTPase A [Bacteroidales bacterium OttesenSCG-928-E04]MDL2327028.1 ribosome small subunit-dependent GTPase A [Bacteroidales bacterium OttesenSCG-928-A14]
MEGIVTKSTGSWYDVRKQNGEIVPCRLRGLFRLKGSKNTNPVVVGDHVRFVIEADNSGYITDIAPRKNYIDRKSTKLSKINHLIAANIDLAFLVVTLREPKSSLGFIDRFLVAAEGFRIPAILLFNKMDIYTEEEKKIIGKIKEIYNAVGYKTVLCSTVTGEGIEEVKVLMQGKVSLFSGHSGVGKSAIINTIFPQLNLKIGEISSYHHKGKHTTTFAQMFPTGNDGFIIDTPGIKEFGLIQYGKDEIRDYFPEIRAYNNCCRFNNCLHLHEPGCAVIQAVEEGEISTSRYYNYLAILEDDDLKIADWELL